MKQDTGLMLSVLTQLVEKDSEHALEYLGDLYKIYDRLGMKDELVEVAEKIVELEPDNLECHF